MNIAQNYALALKQLLEYSDNELIIVEGKTLNIKQELAALEKPIVCPKCSSDKIRIYDSNSVSTQEKEDAEQNGYWLDTQVLGYITCDNCQDENMLTGHVHFTY